MPSRPQSAEKGVLRSSGKADVIVAGIKEDEDALTKAVAAKDNLGIDELILADRVFSVPSETQLLMIDRTFALIQIRSIQGRYKGRSGWVPFE